MNLATLLRGRALPAAAVPIASRPGRWPWRAVLAVMAGLAGLSSAWADPPARVGRVNWTEGSVTLQQAPDPEHPSDAVESPRNWPVTSGDSLITGENSRTEVAIGSTLLRLGENTQVEVARLDDDAVVLRLVEGSLALRVRNGEAARGMEVQAGSARLEPQGAGLFRVDARDGTLSATAWQNGLRIESPANDMTLGSGQRTDFGADGSWYRMSPPEIDRFASWAMNQNEQYGEVADVSPEMTGAADLNQHGDWSTHPEYGRVWAPRVVTPGWAPYRYGHWAWVRPWGWTWIDDTPWGFAPFHYGRWVRWGPRWVWAPGTWVARPTYAPAVVGWAGAPGASVSVSFGPGVGWFPLAPREIYTPYYPCTPRYVRHVNFSHVPRIERAELFIGGPGRVVHAPPSYRYRDEWRTFDGPGHRWFNDRRPPRIVSPGNSLLRPPQAQPPALPIAGVPSPAQQPPAAGFPGSSFGRQPVAPAPPFASRQPAPPVARPVPLPNAMNHQLVAPQPQRQPQAPPWAQQRHPRPDNAVPAVIRPVEQPQPQQHPFARLREGRHHGTPAQPPNAQRSGEPPRANESRRPRGEEGVPRRVMPM
jgi:hypothetical protein